MKRLIAALCLILLLFAGCAKEPSLYDRGMEVVALLEELVGSESYVSAFTANDSIASLILGRLAQGDRSAPRAVYALTFPEAALTEDHTLSMSEGLQKYLSQRALSAIPTQANARAGVEPLAAASVCTVGKTFPCREGQDILYIYTFADALPVSVVFTTGEEGTASATGTFLLDPDFPDSADGIAEYFAELGAMVTEVTE